MQLQIARCPVSRKKQIKDPHIRLSSDFHNIPWHINGQTYIYVHVYIHTYIQMHRHHKWVARPIHMHTCTYIQIHRCHICECTYMQIKIVTRKIVILYIFFSENKKEVAYKSPPLHHPHSLLSISDLFHVGLPWGLSTPWNH